MADTNLLASILAGNDQLAPQMLSGYQGSQLSAAALDPNFGHNEGWGGALAKIIAGIRGGGMTQDAVNGVTQARAAAMPEMAQLLAGDDPYKAAAANPNINPLNLAAILSGATPGSVAEARYKAAQAAKEGLNLRGYQGLPQQVGAVPPNKNAGAVMGGGGAAPMTGGDVSVLGTGRPQAPQPAGIDLSSLAAMPPDQQAQALKSMNPQQKAAMAAQLSRLRAQRLRSAAVPSLGNVAPPT